MFIVVSSSPQTFVVCCMSRIGIIALKRMKWLARPHLILVGRRSSVYTGSVLHLGENMCHSGCPVLSYPTCGLFPYLWFEKGEADHPQISSQMKQLSFFFFFNFNWCITTDWLGLQSFYDDNFATFVYNFYWILVKEFMLLGAATNFHFE